MLIRRIEPQQTGPSVASRTLSIWAVLEGRIGDDKQVLALATALRGTVRLIQLSDTIPQVIAGRALNSLGLHAPWHRHHYGDTDLPDVLIAAGGRSVTLARWVKQASHGRTKTVFLGRPWARLADFDLVITTPQYALPSSPNVQVNLLPLNHVEANRLEEARTRWASSFAHLPRPWIGALIGGNSGSFRMTPRCAERLGARLNRMAQETGGSVLLATSARTPAGCGALIAAALDCPSHVHLWQPGGGENPYLGMIALADQFMVTGESASMIAEAANTGKQVKLFDLQERLSSRILTNWLPAIGLRWALRLGARSGHWTPPRDMRRLHRVLTARGYIGNDAKAFTAAHRMRPIEWDLARTVARIGQLYAAETMDRVRSAAPSTALANHAI
jgi:mitochondrial fission protein ELM1